MDFWGLLEPWVAYVALLLSILTLILRYRDSQDKVSDRNRTIRLEGGQKLDRAVDLMGGETGTITVVDRMKDEVKLEKIKRLLAEVREGNPGDDVVFSSRIAREWGIYWVVRGKPDRAIVEIRKAIKLAPDDAEAHSNLKSIPRATVCDSDWMLDLSPTRFAHDLCRQKVACRSRRPWWGCGFRW